MLIREIEKSDFPALLSLWKNEIGSSKLTIDNIISHYSTTYGDTRYKTFVALLENQVVGFVSSVRSSAIGSANGFIHIVGIAVCAAQQNKGIGSSLLRHMDEYAKSIGVDSIILCSGVNRTDAHAFYQRNGYDKDSWCFDKRV